MENLALVCTDHHTMLHRGRLTLDRVCDGTWHAQLVGRDGTRRPMAETRRLFER